MGHVLNYSMGDVLTHFRRRNGWTVLRPMGWDSFGLPAENAAIKEGGHPREIVERNIVEIRNQMKRIGWAIDWDREVGAHEPEFYRWTQWLFLRFYERGLAYRKAGAGQLVPVRPDRGRQRVRDRRPLRALRHTWSSSGTWSSGSSRSPRTRTSCCATRAAPGPSARSRSSATGSAAARAPRSSSATRSSTSTSPSSRRAGHAVRRDVLRARAGASAGRAHRDDGVAEYVKATARKKTEERAAEQAKTGVFTGHYAMNPVNGERLPIWVADYVLMDYGTGAIMAVPAHDERDREFAETFDLPIVEVITEDGGSSTPTGSTACPPRRRRRRSSSGCTEGHGAPAVSHRLRDWSFGRQRYWGCPIPIVYCEDCGEVPVPDEQLPVILPEVEDYRPKGKPPLASARSG